MVRNPGSEDTVIDGRVQRGARNREAIVEALLGLLEDGESQPSAATIAARAGVSVRSVFQHFDDMESLYKALIERQMEHVIEMFEEIDPSLPLEQRIENFVAVRARIFERVTPVRKAALLAAPSSPALRQGLAGVATLHERDVISTFGGDFEQLAITADARAAVTLATSWEAWDRLRTAQRCSVAKARRTVVTMVKALLRA